MRAEGLEIVRKAFEESGNPYFAWEAIHQCIKANTPFPNWLIAYLAQCSERMHSNKAEQTSDLRKVLPWILGFQMKRGPRNLLRPGYDSKKIKFVIKFGRLIVQGQDPVTARRDACNAVFDGKDAEVDDKTLVRWVLNAFGLKKVPKNTKQWKEVARKNLVAIFATRALLRSATTKAEMDEIIALVKEIPELIALANRIPEQWTKSRETLP
jgi:hypothetical protein